MHNLVFALWLSLQDAELPDDHDDDDDDDKGGGLGAPVQPPQSSRWPPRIRLFLPELVPVPVPVGV